MSTILRVSSMIKLSCFFILFFFFLKTVSCVTCWRIIILLQRNPKGRLLCRIYSSRYGGQTDKPFLTILPWQPILYQVIYLCFFIWLKGPTGYLCCHCHISWSHILTIYCWKKAYSNEQLEKLPGKQTVKHKQNIIQVLKPKKKLKKSQISIQLSLEEEMLFQIAALAIRWWV